MLFGPGFDSLRLHQTIDCGHRYARERNTMEEKEKERLKSAVKRLEKLIDMDAPKEIILGELSLMRGIVDIDRADSME